MKICKIYIRGFQQFQDVELDFTNPETGEPVEKVCFIGSNGTGKSTLLKLIKFADNKFKPDIQPYDNFPHHDEAKVVFQLRIKNDTYFLYYHKNVQFLFNGKDTAVKNNMFALKLLNEDFANFFSGTYWMSQKTGLQVNENHSSYNLEFKNNSSDIFIYSPAESLENEGVNIADVPEASVNQALDLSNNYPYYIEVSQGKISSFWKTLVYNIRKRAEERERYEEATENIKKSKEQLIEEFDKISPKILFRLAALWDKILNKSGLYFDAKRASNPFQLKDNLKAYIKLIRTDTIIPYGELSTGIRNYIFRIGHIFSLYFNREIDKGIVLIDEPENSLYPDFLLDLIDIYKSVVLDKRGQNNTQMFFATHSPLIAAQFKPYERIILEWKEDGSVSAHKGRSPEGDDPNDILLNDFGLTEVMGKAGEAKWKEYQDKMDALASVSNKEDKVKLAKEISELGRLYNFPAV
jgi:predicted ATP-dependent endonuclease of OLD family